MNVMCPNPQCQQVHRPVNLPGLGTAAHPCECSCGQKFTVPIAIGTPWTPPTEPAKP